MLLLLLLTAVVAAVVAAAVAAVAVVLFFTDYLCDWGSETHLIRLVFQRHFLSELYLI